jgi:hypothetical protein
VRNVHTAPMEVFAQIPNGTYELEPYEAGWAAEALAMVYVREAHGDAPRLRLTAQISVDGVRWIDTAHALTIRQPGGYALSLTHFGNWLRLAGVASGGPADGPAFVADFFWVLKS